VRVSSDKQTLILAGEAIPPPRVAAGRSETGSQLQRVTMLVVRGEYGPTAVAADSSSAKFSATADSESDLDLLPSVAAINAPALAAQFLVPYPSSNRALSAGAAEYARTQDLSGGRTRSRLIDTYA
jgi:hypothetical protein